MPPQKKPVQDVPGFGAPEDQVEGFGPPEAPATTSPDVAAHAPIPGFMSRFTEAMGLPTPAQALHNAAYGTAEIAHGAPIPSPISQYIDNLRNTGKEAVSTYQNASPDNKLGAAVEGGTKFLTGGVLSPFGGRALYNMSDDLQAHNFGAAGGDLLGTIGNILLLKSGLRPTEEMQLNKLTAAMGPKASKSLANTLDLLNQKKESFGTPINNVGDFKDLINKTKNDINSEYGNAIGPYANTKIAANPISDAIKTLITPDMDMTREGRLEKQAINNAAAEYEKPWSLGALDSKRSRLAADLSSHNSKEPVSRYTAERGNINVAIDNKILGALRNEIYPRADVLAGKPSGYFENLKQQQSNLIQLESLTNKRIDELTGKTRESKGASPLSRLHGNVGFSASMTPHGYVGGLSRLLHAPDLLGEANTAVKQGMRSANPVSQGIVLSYPIRTLSNEQTKPWWDDTN